MSGPLGQLRLIWMALVLGVVSYGAVVVGLIALEVVALELFPVAFIPFFGLGVIGMMFVGLQVRRRLVAAIPADAPAESRIQQYSTACIVGLALAEGSGFTLVTVSLMASSQTWAMAGAAATVGAMLLQRPSEAEIGLGS